MIKNNALIIISLMIIFALCASCGHKSVDSYSKEIKELIENQKYEEAYKLSNEMILYQPKEFEFGPYPPFFIASIRNDSWYNEGIELRKETAKIEIAELIEESEKEENAPKIIFIIENKILNNKYKFGNNNKKEVYDYALSLTKSINNTELRETLERYNP